MAYKKMMFGDQEVEVRCSAATKVLFKQVFKFDLLKTLTKMRDFKELDDDAKFDASLDAEELLNKLAYIMAAQGRMKSCEEYKKLNTDDYVFWLDKFEEIPTVDILNLYNNGEVSTEKAKKAVAVQSES